MANLLKETHSAREERDHLHQELAVREQKIKALMKANLDLQ